MFIGKGKRARKLSKYECSGQMQLFDYIEKDSNTFCWDDNINEIVGKLEELANTYGMEVGKAEFTVWDHVPHLGYRLWLDILGTKNELFRENFQNDVGKIVVYAKSKNVELTPMWGAVMFFGNSKDEKARLHFTTMFMDKQRQHRK